MKNIRYIILLCCISISLSISTVHAGLKALPNNTNQAIDVENLPVQVFKHTNDLIDFTIQHNKARSIDFKKEAQEFIKRSYISPEMQYPVLSLIQQPFTIMHTSGFVPNIPTVEQIITKVEELYRNKTTDEQTKQEMIEALTMTLEAIDIATFAAIIEAAYENTADLFAPPVDPILKNHFNTYRQMVEIKLQEIQPNSSWIPSWFSLNSTQAATDPATSKRKNIIYSNNYKNLKNDPLGKKAANLLFKQCFVSQQYLKYINESYRNNSLHINIQDPSNLLQTVPNIDQFCLIIQNMATNSLDILKDGPEIHQLVLHVRQAVQIAIYVANKKSSVNIGYILPASITSMLDSVVNQLLQYDTKLDAMCKDKSLGASDYDFYRDQAWKNISYMAASLAVIGAGAALYYDIGGSKTSMIKNSPLEDLQNLMNNPQKYMYNASKKIVNSGLEYGINLYNNMHNQPTDPNAEPFIDKKHANELTNIGVKVIAPSLVNSMTSNEPWTDEEAKQAYYKLADQTGKLAKSGVTYSVKSTLTSPITKLSNSFNQFIDTLQNKQAPATAGTIPAV